MTTKPSIRAPKQIRGYNLQDPLGRGGMGEVFLASHELLERPVAIKRYAPLPGTPDKEQHKERFLREGKALSKLHHSGIVGIHDLFEFRGELYMVLEYVNGYHLGELLQQGPLPLDIVCIIGFKLAEALEHAHLYGIIHRDIKASNVMISRQGQVKLMDFGIAVGETLADITQTGMLVGTPRYLAPELIIEGKADARTDIYGLGALLYHCLTGKGLFFENTDQNLYKRIVAGKFTPIGKVVKGVPRRLGLIVEQCLARKPEKRFASATSFRQNLDLFMASRRMWASHSERLIGFLRAEEHISQVEFDQFNVSQEVLQRSPAQTPRGFGYLVPWFLFLGLLGISLVILYLWLSVNGWIELGL